MCRARNAKELSFQQGEELLLISKAAHEWWFAAKLDRPDDPHLAATGWVPFNYFSDSDSATDKVWDASEVDGQDESYFDNYGNSLTVHYLMLQDKIRTQAFLDAINMHVCRVFIVSFFQPTDVFDWT